MQSTASPSNRVLSVVVLAYNEEETLLSIIKKLLTADDCSADSTPAVPT